MINETIKQPNGHTDFITVEIKTLSIEEMENAIANKADMQRAIRQWHRTKLVEDMQSGNFWFNGSPIVFDQDGRLIDGQHRLASMIKAGKTYPLIIVSGVSPDSYIAIDAGVGKSAGDFFKFTGIQNANLAAATARWILRYHKSDDGKFFHIGHTTRSDILETYRQHEEGIIDSFKQARNHRSFFGSAAMASALWFLIQEAYGEEIASQFFSTLESGIGNSLVVSLRKTLIKDNNRVRKHIHPDSRFISVIEAARSFASKTTRHNIKPAIQKLQKL